MIKRVFTLLTMAGVFALAGCQKTIEPTAYVNTKIGTGGHGHVFVGANVPFGFVQLGPTSIPQEWDWCSGYHDSDSTIIGFSHTHLSGTGIGDLFDVTVMPVTGEVKYARGEENNPTSGLWSYAARSSEKCVPGYYSVNLLRYGIKAELTASERVGWQRYTFPASESPAIVFDLENGGCWDKTTDCDFVIDDVKKNSISGYRYSSGWAKNQKIFFYSEFSKPFTSFEIVEVPSKDGDKMLKAYAKFNFAPTKDGERILVKTALSPVSIDGAKMNMKAEAGDWNFDKKVKEADKAWNKELSKIAITSSDENNKTVFYTALYHSMIAPSLFCDVNNDYRGADDSVNTDADFKNYTTFSLWDTYRAAHPLMAIIHPEKMNDMVKTMLNIYEQQGKLPVWHLMGNETDCMVGNPGVIALGDAIVKGFDDFDMSLAYNAMKNSVMLDERGQDLRKKYGYIPSDKYNESVANDMEYAIADAAVARVAEYLGEEEDAQFFSDRSKSYRHYMDKKTLFARGRFANGKWRTPFNPFASNHRDQDYCEGNAWQYTWLAPQDFDGLVNFYGSKEKLVERLDTLFAVSSKIEGDNVSPDISGMIGQYVHGNEPSHHIIYFYTMAGRSDKAAERVREVLRTMYDTSVEGLSGNEDVGQMSAWYILSSLGFYQVEPAVTRYWFGSPLFDKAVIKVKGGEFTVKAENNSAENKYIQSVSLNGMPYEKPYIDFSDIAAGGELVFNMGAKPVSL